MLFNLQEDQIFYARKIFCSSLMACLIAIILLSAISFNTVAVVAQIPTIPSLPLQEEDEENDNQELSVDNSIPTIPPVFHPQRLQLLRLRMVRKFPLAN